MTKKRLLFIAPHLSTGGMPQYLYEYIKYLKKSQPDYEIDVIEWDDVTGGVLVVSKNRIKSELKKGHLHTLGGNKEDVKKLISKINPDVIHFHETPESFISSDILDWIYRKDRSYNIVVTTHSSYTDPSELRYLADKFILVCNWSKNRFEKELGLDIPCDVWEYTSDRVEYDKDEAKKELGFDPEYRHVLNVGLFTSNKNQGELIEIARTSQNEKIKFHFVGNQAMNFQDYWKPLMENLPSNCTWHGERDDVDKFYKAADLFYFPSKLELNPLAIKEAISYGLPILLRKLDVYTEPIPNSKWLGESIVQNRKMLHSELGINSKLPRIEVVHLLTDITHPREGKSIELISKLKQYGFHYRPVINKIFEGTPPAEFCSRPDHIGNKSGYIGNGYGTITGRHYGCYLAHINGLKSISDEYDYTLFFEADADIQTSYEEFVDIVYRGCEVMERDDVKYLSFSDNRSNEKTPVDDYFQKTAFNQDCAHAYLISNKDKGWWMERIRTVKWDSADIWYNDVFAYNPVNRYTTLKSYSEQLATETSSLLDPRVKLDDSLIVVLTYADTDYRKQLLDECISEISTPLLVSSHYPVDINIQEKSDWVLYDKKNPLLYKSEYDRFNVKYNYWVFNENKEKVHMPLEYEHAYAVYTLIQNALRFGKSQGFEDIHIINYDYKIPNYVLEKQQEYLKSHSAVFYKYGDDSYSTGFFSGKVDVLLEYFNLHNSFEEYYSQEYMLLEERVFKYYSTDISRLKVMPFTELQHTTLTNQEGTLEFSNSKILDGKTFEELGKKYECDKVTYHQYHLVYPEYFDKFRTKKFNLFEIGVDEGKSFKMWCDYFPNASIYGLDIKSEFSDKRGTIFRGDQNNLQTLEAITKKINTASIIIDDGSHNPNHQIKTFHYLFDNLLERGGVYIIEDIETSYWNPVSDLYGFEIGYLNVVDYFTKLNHQVNSKYNGIENPQNIHSITFASNCIIIRKNV